MICLLYLTDNIYLYCVNILSPTLRLHCMKFVSFVFIIRLIWSDFCLWSVCLSKTCLTIKEYFSFLDTVRRLDWKTLKIFSLRFVSQTFITLHFDAFFEFYVYLCYLNGSCFTIGYSKSYLNVLSFSYLLMFRVWMSLSNKGRSFSLFSSSVCNHVSNKWVCMCFISCDVLETHYPSFNDGLSGVLDHCVLNLSKGSALA